MANRFLNNITINDEYTLPAADGTADQIIVTDGAGNLSFIDTTTISVGEAEQVHIACKNTSGVAISKGDPVYITGTVGTSYIVEIAAADASNSAKMPAVGLAQTDLAINAEGYVVVSGVLKNLTTDPLSTGDGTPSSNDTVYVKAGGGLTRTKPTGSSNLIQNVGKVGRVQSSSAGSIAVSTIMRTNDVPNLSTGKIWVGSSTYTTESGVVHLDEGNSRMGINTTSPSTSLDINGITTSKGFQTNTTNTDYNLISRNSAGNVTLYVQSATSNTDQGIAQFNYGSATANSGTQVLKVAKDNSYFVNTNVGIGTTSPSAKLDSISPDGNTNSLRLGRSDNSNYWDFNHAGNDLRIFNTAGAGSDVLFGVNSGGTRQSNKVGILTATANVALQVGDGTADDRIRAYFSDGSYTQIAGYGFDLSRGTSYLRPTVTATKNLYIGQNTKAWATLANYATGSFQWGNASSELMRLVSSTGRLGIGTTSPSAKLHIEGDGSIIRLQNNNSDTNGTFIDFRDSTGTRTGYVGTTGTSDDMFLFTQGAKPIRFWTNASERMVINSNGALQLNNYGSGTFTGTAAKMLAVDSSGNVIEETISSATIGGSGTTNYIPVFTSSTTIASSIMSQSSGVIDINGTIRYDEQVASNQNNGAKAFIAVSSGSGAEKYKVYKNTNTTDGYARFKLDRAYDYGNNDQMVQEAIYQRRTTTKNVKFRYDGDIATADDSYLEFYELTDGTVEAWVCVDDFSKSFVEIYYDSNVGETYPNPSAATPTGTLIHSTNPDTETPNWDTYQGTGKFNGDVNIDSSYALQFDGVDVVDVTTTYTRLRDMAGTTRIYLGASDAQNYYDNSQHRFRNSGGGTTYGIWNSTGLGIGTTSFGSKLHVEDASSNCLIRVVSNAASIAGIDFGDTADADVSRIRHYNADNSLRISTNGTERIRIESGGNVGIGTTSPGSKLEVKGTGGSSSGLNLSSTNEIFRQYFSSDAAGSAFLMTYDGTGGSDLQIESSGNIIMANGTGGNVGIGTTSPNATLDVNGAGNFSGGTLVSGIDTKTDAAIAIPKGDYIQWNDGNYLRRLIGSDGSGNIEIGQAGTGLIGDILLRPGTAGNIRFFGTGSEDMRITSSGNVGIGTTSPTQPLEVNGNIQATGSRTISAQYDSNHYMRLESNSSGGVLRGLDGGVTTVLVRSYGESYFNGGNVGIGTTSPTYKLDVVGAIGMNTYLYHNDDTDTFIGYSANDTFDVNAGGVKQLSVTSDNVNITDTLSYTYPSATDEYNGEIVTFGTFDSAITAGDVIVYTTAGLSTGWFQALGNTTYGKGMLGIAMGTSPSDGILIKGFARSAVFSSGVLGNPLYLSATSAGDTTNTAPSSTNNVVRIVGYMLNPTNDEIFFDPDKSWVQVS